MVAARLTHQRPGSVALLSQSVYCVRSKFVASVTVDVLQRVENVVVCAVLSLLPLAV